MENNINLRILVVFFVSPVSVVKKAAKNTQNISSDFFFWMPHLKFCPKNKPLNIVVDTTLQDQKSDLPTHLSVQLKAFANKFIWIESQAIIVICSMCQAYVTVGIQIHTVIGKITCVTFADGVFFFRSSFRFISNRFRRCFKWFRNQRKIKKVWQNQFQSIGVCAR